MFRSYLLLATTLLVTTACLGDAAEAPRDVATSESAQALLAPPRLRIAHHPDHEETSASMDAQLVALATNLLTLEDLSALRAELMQCLESGDVRPCVPKLQALGVSVAELAKVGEQANTISQQSLVSDEEREPQALARAFRGARELTRGPDDDAVEQIVAASGLACDASCREQVGEGFGESHGNALARLSQSTPSSGDGGGGGGGGGGGAAVIIAAIEIAVEVIIWIEDTWWNSDEEDKECHHDSDCPSDEYCHKVGDNDCRPKLGTNQLCSRDGNCRSDRCVPYIGCGFLLCCRP
jgi:hypothetical protein